MKNKYLPLRFADEESKKAYSDADDETIEFIMEGLIDTLKHFEDAKHQEIKYDVLEPDTMHIVSMWHRPDETITVRRRRYLY